MTFDVEVRHVDLPGELAGTVEPPRERGRLREWTADTVWTSVKDLFSIGAGIVVERWEIHGGEGRGWLRRGKPGEHGLVLDGAKVIYFVKKRLTTGD